MGTLIGPFGDEAVAALIGAFIAALVAFLLYYLNKKKPQYLVCEEELRTSVVEVREMEEEELKISYGDQEVQNLSLLRLRLFNSGSETIKDADICVRLNEEVKILELRFKIEPKSATGQDQIFPHLITPDLTIPNLLPPYRTFHIKYLKPFKPYKQWIGVDLICDGQIREIDISGDGEGWTVKPSLVEARGRRTARRVITTSFIWILATAVTALIMSGFTEYKTSFILAGAGFATFFGGVVLPRLMDWVRDAL